MTQRWMYAFAAIALFCTFLAGLNVFLWNHSRTQDQRIANLQAAHVSDLKQKEFTINITYQRCVASLPEYQKLTSFINGVKELSRVLTLNSVENHDATPPGTALYKAQAKNFKRLQRVEEEVSGLVFPHVSKKVCAAQQKAQLAQLTGAGT